MPPAEDPEELRDDRALVGDVVELSKQMTRSTDASGRSM